MTFVFFTDAIYAFDTLDVFDFWSITALEFELITDL